MIKEVMSHLLMIKIIFEHDIVVIPNLVKSVESFDVRLLINSAKILSELESLLKSEYLTGIDIVSESASSIKLFSVQLRMKSQDRLLTSLKEKSQVDIANCLQVQISYILKIL
jgi:hypothetical protein